ncbi:hypothetical protein V3C99_000958 [Haemonchus contortus]|uniref:HTH_Tnp_Tc3_2 domain-containing protein n=1 Tax=Haemonchus contortus TaxID=6289 RepID=A0A7I4YG26_HAECO
MCLTKNAFCEHACGATSSKENRLLNLIVPHLKYTAKKPCQKASVHDCIGVSKKVMKAWRTKNMEVGPHPHQTTRQLATHVGCSKFIIHEQLLAIGKKNRCRKWVPHKLSDSNQATQVAMAEILLHRSKNSGFFNSIITSDGNWICFDKTTRKEQWLDADDTPKPTTKPDTHGRKVMLCVWWNSKG